MMRTLTLLLATLLALAAPSRQARGQDVLPGAQPLRVVIVHSYNPEYVWTQNINQGVQDALQGLKIAYDVRYMDAKRRPDPDRLRQTAQEILQRIDRLRPQVVITVDDVAQAYLAAPFLKGRADLQVVFCGVNAPLPTYGFPASNASGVRERWHYREGFSLLQKIVPSARSVAFLVDDSESAGYVSDDLLAERSQTGAFALELAGVERIKTFQEWQRRILHYQTAADALALGLYNSLVDERTGQVTHPDDVMAWTNAHNTKPTLGFSDIAKDHDLLCGVLESAHEQGFLAGSMARVVLTRNAPAGDLPVRINNKGIILVNMRTAERLGVQVPYEIIEAAGVVVR